MDHNRVETVLSALNRGCSSEWAEDHILAHGLCGQRNKLGNAINHLIATPSNGNMQLTVFILSGELIKQKLCRSRDAVDIARNALEYYLTRLCMACQGRGVVNLEQQTCDVCGGTGRRPMNKEIERPIALIEASIDMMEGQLEKRLSYRSVGIEISYHSAIPVKGVSSDQWVSHKKPASDESI